MATVIVAVGQAGKAGQASRSPVMLAPIRARQSITTSSSNAVSTVILSAGEVAMISVNGGAVNVAAGSSPNAATTPDFVLADGALFPIEALTDGVLIAVADA